ncbi:MAG: response regulator [Acidobacteria bacterium]|nr:response regulator [Acidobacteriota bacterium]
MYPLHTKRILYVDDDVDSADLLRFYFPTLEMVHAATVAEGLRLAKTENFAVYLFDVQLYDGTGIELCKQVRAFDPQTPILFLSADARHEIRDRALQSGAQSFITKPFNLEELKNLLTTLLASDSSASE